MRQERYSLPDVGVSILDLNRPLRDALSEYEAALKEYGPGASESKRVREKHGGLLRFNSIADVLDDIFPGFIKGDRVLRVK